MASPLQSAPRAGSCGGFKPARCVCTPPPCSSVSVWCSDTAYGRDRRGTVVSFPILTSLIAVPALGALLLLFVKDDEQHEGVIRKVSLIVSLLVVAETLLMWARFDPASADFQF